MNNNIRIKRKKIYFFIYFFLITLIILSILYIFSFLFSKKEAFKQSNLLNTIDIDKNFLLNSSNSNETSLNNNSLNITNENEEKNSENNVDTERMIKVKSLKEENSDIVGWLEIPDTNINYPVLQHTDDEYYMTHNYKKEKSKNGSIFLSKDYDFSIPSSNLLIYGHNLGNGAMFQELLKYENESFYKEHPIIRFTTVNDDSEYEIISVFKSRVYYKSETNVFRYYYFINAKNEAEYDEFVQNAKNASLYNIDATASYNEQLITLSTCSYYVKDGRFAIVARKIYK